MLEEEHSIGDAKLFVNQMFCVIFEWKRQLSVYLVHNIHEKFYTSFIHHFVKMKECKFLEYLILYMVQEQVPKTCLIWFQIPFIRAHI
jgi:hypothetical protein